MSRDVGASAHSADLADERVIAPASTEHHHAIVIGIDRYPALSDLRGACTDAVAVGQWLVDPDGGAVPPDNVRLHLGREAADARSATPKKWQIDADLDELVEAVRRPAPTSGSTRLYLYFAGHGIAAGMGTGAWLMADAKHNLFNNLALTPYREWLDRCRDFEEVVIFSDCCRSIMTVVQEAPQPHSCDAPGPREQRVLLAHAADIGAAAFEDTRPGDDGPRGTFTRALLEGLGGAAADASGAVRAGPLAMHLRARVRELSRGAQRAQVVADDRIVLRRSVDATASVRIELGGDGARRVQVLGAGGIAATEVRTAGPWELHLPDGEYRLVDDASDRVVRFTVAGPSTVTVTG